MITVKKVETKEDLKKFIDFPYDLYQGDPVFVPELFLAQEEMFDRKINPFFKHSRADYFLALDGDKPAGRIVAFTHKNYTRYSGKNCAFFGFLEVIENYEVFKALLDQAVKWAKSENCDSLAGPENFFMNVTTGMLVDGYDIPPAIMLPYNKPYYPVFTEKYGFKKTMDLYAYSIEDTQKDTFARINSLSDKLEAKLKKRGHYLKVRQIEKFQDGN